jgi:hypothetical protein
LSEKLGCCSQNFKIFKKYIVFPHLPLVIGKGSAYTLLGKYRKNLQFQGALVRTGPVCCRKNLGDVVKPPAVGMYQREGR